MLSFALVGCGGMAHWHAQQLQKIQEAKVVALVDPITSQTAVFKDKYFADAVEFESYDRLLDKPPTNLDAVVLVTPHTVHFTQAKAALSRGIHVLVEKPMVTSSDDAYDLWRAVNTSGKKLGITGWLSQGWMNATAGKWRQDPKHSGGGQMYDSGAHVLNAIMWLVNSPVVEVACFYNRCGTPVDINGVAILKFENGAMGSVAIGGSGTAWDTEIRIQTDKLVAKTLPHGGMLEMFGPHGRRIYPHVEQPDHPAGGTPHVNFVNAILGREPLVCGVRYGVLLSALMDALYDSADRQSLVQVKPVPREL
jgi:predicted dehydrogenase